MRNSLQSPIIKHGTINILYTDIRFKDETRYNDNLNATNPKLKMRQIYWRYSNILDLIRQQTSAVDSCKIRLAEAILINKHNIWILE